MRRVLRALSLLLVPVMAASGEEFLRLDALVQEAIRNNPELQAAQKRVEAARQRPRQEGALPNPMVSVGYNAVGPPLPGFGLGREPVANIGFMVSQELPYPGKRQIMAARAKKEADAELESYNGAERAILARLKQAFHRLHHADEAQGVMQRAQEVLVSFIKLAQARYSSGKGMQQEIFRAQMQLAVMETRIVKMRQDAEMARAEINAILHRPVNSPMANPAPITAVLITATQEQIAAAAEKTSPMIARDQKMAEARQLGVSLARKNFYPDFGVSAGYYNMGAMPPMFEVKLDVKVPAWRGKNEAALTEQVQSLAQARHTYAATSHEVRWRVKELYIAAQTSWRLIELYRDSVIPQAELATASSLAQYESGSADATQVLMSLMARFDQEERYHEEMLNYFTALIRLEELSGMELL